MADLEFKLKTLAPIWTGGVEGKDEKLHLPGIKGSIRWWMETLVRGLGYYACNPGSKNSKDKCEFDTKAYEKTNNLYAELKNICPVCQIFGCTGWSGKIILRIDEKKDKDDKKKECYEPINSLFDRKISFSLRFIERKKLESDEKKLLKAALKLIVEYGALGGKTTLKPSEIANNKNYESYPKNNHLDYGIIDYQKLSKEKITVKGMSLNNPPCKSNKPDWPNLINFWFVKDLYLHRININELVNRDKSNEKKYAGSATEKDVFIGGYIKDDKKHLPNNIEAAIIKREVESDGESKKIFSFHGFPRNNGGKDGFSPRCFGYASDTKKRNEIGDKVKDIFNGKMFEFKTGEEVLDEL